MSKEFDIVLYGATSFVGQIASKYLVNRIDGNMKWAIAGRSDKKLDVLLDDLKAFSPNAKLPEKIVADAGDKDSLNAMCKKATVIISTVGPYALYGEPLIEACIAENADYVDLTGEPQWIHKMLSKHQAAAQTAGVHLVNCCGFDSIPSDLGVYFLQKEAKEKLGEYCQRVAMRVHRIKGGASGGTIASMLNLLDEVKRDPSLRKVIASPFGLCPQGHGFKAYQPNLKWAKFDTETNKWMAPFVMAAINTRIVHRSNALLESQYGDRFVYDEAMLTGGGLSGAMRGFSMSGGLAGFMVGANISFTRSWMENSLLPKPGEGPTPEQQEKGMFDIRFYGHTADGQTLTAKVVGDRDPGYGSTAKMLSEAAICLSQNEKVREASGGFYTPASIFKHELFEQLETHAGLSFQIL